MDEKFVFQGVGMIFNGGFDERKWEVPESERESRFVFIGKHLDHELLREGFMACRVSNELRFKIGDEVEANVGTFQKGKIVKLWDEGNAYRIQLDNNDKVNGTFLTDKKSFHRTTFYSMCTLLVFMMCNKPTLCRSTIVSISCVIILQQL